MTIQILSWTIFYSVILVSMRISRKCVLSFESCRMASACIAAAFMACISFILQQNTTLLPFIFLVRHFLQLCACFEVIFKKRSFPLNHGQWCQPDARRRSCRFHDMHNLYVLINRSHVTVHFLVQIIFCRIVIV